MSTLEELVADLTTATTDLLEEVTDQKDRLTVAADSATASAASASSDAASALVSEANAAASAQSAELISGLETVEDAVDLEMNNRGIVPQQSGRVKVIYDVQGNINEMVMIPAFNCEDINAAILDRYSVDMQLGTGLHPAFKTGSVARNHIWVAKYQASAGVGGTCSVVPNAQPRHTINYDAAKLACTDKGVGWHLMSAHEWAAAALWSIAYGAIPRGNTNYGRSHEYHIETARRSDTLQPGDFSGTARTYTGTGPAAWSHDHTVFGIADLVGNVWEWVDQLKMVDGQIIATADNAPDTLEANWVPHNAYFDAVNTIELSDSVSVTGNTKKGIADVGQSATYTPNLLLRQLLVEFAAKPLDVGRLEMNNEGERLPARGGFWDNGPNAGLGALSLSGVRSGANIGTGFRPCYFE